MVKYLLLLILSPCISQAQDYKTFADFSYRKDTIIYQGVRLVPGDSIRLGYGSGPSKQFVFVSQQTANMKKYVKGIDHPLPQMANVYLILKRVEVVNKKQHGVDLSFVEPIFGYKMGEEKIEWMIQFRNAIGADEISFVKKTTR